MAQFVIYVKTGDKKFAGTDANIKIILHDDSGQKTEDIELDNFFHNDFERGELDTFSIGQLRNKGFNGKVCKIEFWRDNAGFGAEWYLERIDVENKSTKDVYVFPVLRWIRPHYHYFINHLDTSLPQADPHSEQRKEELKEKCLIYEPTQKIPQGPMQIKKMPDDEAFSCDYQWDIFAAKTKLIATSKIVMFTTGKWEGLDDLKNIYTKEIFYEPLGAQRWSNDLYFGRQRIASMNHSCIELCTKIPDNLAVSDEMLKPFLDGMTLQQVLDAKRLFIVDHKILSDVEYENNEKPCAPIALFFVNGDQHLLPIAIQLFQEPGKENPVFLPSDPPYTWLTAKLWFNMADASVHQSLTHLGFTHLLMEGVAVVTNRQLAQSHPLFKLLAPHFLYLIAINTRALEVLISPGGWIDKTMKVGAKGIFEIIKKGIINWRMDVEGTLPEDLKRRNVYDKDVLPGYHFRDDALLLYDAIYKYVKNYVDLYYDTQDKITGDWELQAWGAELVLAKDQGGCGLLGVPGNGKFTSKDQLYIVLTSVVYTCSVGHAAANFPQYDEYGFSPNYPLSLNGRPPTDKTPLEEKHIVDILPDKPTTLDAMIVTKILSEKGTKSLGDFEVQYIFEPEALKIVEEFRADLAKIGQTINERNKIRNPPYCYLEPENIPNAISI